MCLGERRQGMFLIEEISNQEEPYIHITVRNPRTHISREKALYTDYETVVKTNNIAFASTESCVRRRYSDFSWLRKRLIEQYKWVVCPPELPSKRLFGRFQRQFLKRRQQGLQEFLEGVVKENTYLSDVALHLFLQSNLSVKDIERHLDGTDSGGEIVETLESPGKGRPSGLSRSMTNIEEKQPDGEVNYDSGCCYSTTSSINDLMQTPAGKAIPQEDWKYYFSVPANLDKFHKYDAVEAHDGTQQTCCISKPDKTKMFQLDSGNVTSSSQQSLTNMFNRTGSISEDDFIGAADYDADDESDMGEHDCDEEISFPGSSAKCMQKNTELLNSIPRISVRIQNYEDSDDCFRESEYDVIDSDDNGNCDSPSKRKSSFKKKRCSSYSEVKSLRRIRRSASQNDSETKRNTKYSNYNSLPIIRREERRKISRSLYFGCNLLESHKEEESVETRKLSNLSVESSNTNSSRDKAVRSEEDSFLPPSTTDIDSCATWNTPECVRKFTRKDFTDSYDCRTTNTEDGVRFSANLYTASPEILSSVEMKIPGESTSGQELVNGRFRVTTIRDETSDTPSPLTLHKNFPIQSSNSENDLSRIPSLSSLDFEKLPLLWSWGLERETPTSDTRDFSSIQSTEPSTGDSVKAILSSTITGTSSTLTQSEGKIDNSNALGDTFPYFKLRSDSAASEDLELDKMEDTLCDTAVCKESEGPSFLEFSSGCSGDDVVLESEVLEPCVSYLVPMEHCCCNTIVEKVACDKKLCLGTTLHQDTSHKETIVTADQLATIPELKESVPESEAISVSTEQLEARDISDSVNANSVKTYSEANLYLNENVPSPSDLKPDPCLVGNSSYPCTTDLYVSPAVTLNLSTTDLDVPCSPNPANFNVFSPNTMDGNTNLVNGPSSSSPVEFGVSRPDKLDLSTCTTSLNGSPSPLSIDLNVSSLSQLNCNTTFLNGSPADINLFNVIGRAVSPSFSSVLKTYEVIQEFPCNLEEYEILEDKRRSEIESNCPC